MTDEERKSVDEVVKQAMKPLDDLISKLSSADGTLVDLRIDVRDIKREQEYQSKDIEAIHHDMRGIHGTVDHIRSDMPKRWKADIESKFAQRDEVTGAVDTALERAKAAAEKKSDGVLRTVFQGTGKYIFLVTIAFAVTLGGVLASQCGNGNAVEPDDLEAYGDKLMKRLDSRLEKMNGGTHGSQD